jgi:pyrroline-5-carboxylate reductase
MTDHDGTHCTESSRSVQVEGQSGELYNPDMLKQTRIALIGGGNMTEALVNGLLSAGQTAPENLYGTDVRPDRVNLLRERYGIRAGGQNRETAAWGQIIILSVEPQVLPAVMKEIRPVISPPRLLISVAAGYPIRKIAAEAPAGVGIVRVMPNTPASILAGISALTYGAGVSESDQMLARMIFESVGKVICVEERLMDAVTALSGSGPAYVYLMVEALADGGVRMGLPRSTAELLAAQTVLGAAQMMLETGEHPARLKDRIASPGGTTMAGLYALESAGFRATIISAIEAAFARSGDLCLDKIDLNY